MTLGFGGEVAEYYARYRHGYPPEALDLLQDTFALTAADTVLDLGCGTGQLALPLAARVGAVIGMDPEPDMLHLARQAAREQGTANLTWVLGADTDLPVLGALLGGRRLALTVVGQALHWMDHRRLFARLPALCRPGGGVAVIANGSPLWLQDSDWSRRLRAALEQYLGTELTASCGTAPADRFQYEQALRAAEFTHLRTTSLTRAETLGPRQLIGSLYSAFPADLLPPPAERPAFAERLLGALPGQEEFTEEVEVVVLTAKAPSVAGS